MWTRLLVVVVLVLLGVLAYQVTRTALALRQAESVSEAAQRALADSDLEAARASAEELRRSADVARRHSDGWLWGATTVLPYLGDDADAVRRLSAALDEVARAAPEGLEVLQELRDGGLRSETGAVDLDAVRSVQAPLADLDAASGRAEQLVAGVDPDGLIGPLAGRSRAFLERLETLRGGSRAASVAADVLPGVLGGDGQRRYLLVVENNAEIRSTGGLPGSASVMTARQGSVELGFQGDQGDFATGGPPVLEPLPGEKQVFGPLLLNDFRDATFTPDFPRAAEIMAAHARGALDTGGELDGVISIDPVALAEVLRATGPIEADGQRFTADTAVRQLLFEPYARFEDPARQDAYFRAAARGILDALVRARGDQAELLRVLSEATTQRRLQFWSTDDAVQSQVVDYAIAGALPRDTGRPEVGVYLDDATQAKIQFFLRHQTEVRSLGCDAEGRQGVEARLELRSQVPEPVGELPEYVVGSGSKAPPGDMRMLVRLFAPQGGELTGLRVDDEPVRVGGGTVYDRKVTQFYVQLEPGQRTEVLAQFRGAPGEDGEPRLQSTPGIVWGPSQQTAASGC